MEKLIYDKPACQGEANVLKRAKILSDVRWTPQLKMPKTYNVPKAENPANPYPRGFWKTWRPEYGVPYSSVRIPRKFIGYNVSLETFISALENPKSVLYTRNLTGQGERMSSWYGAVCSSFVCYALDLPSFRVCRNWGSYGDMTEVPEFTAQDLKLCDILCSPGHVGIVTAVARNEKGEVVYVTVSECTPPKVIVVEFTADEVLRCWPEKYKLFRYDHLDKVTYTPSPYVKQDGDPDLPVPPVNKVLLPDYGNRANYAQGEPVELNVMQEGWERLIIETENGETVFEAAITEPGVVSWTPDATGYYRAYCVRAGETSDAVEFCMADFPVTVRQEGEDILLDFTAPEGEDVICCSVYCRSDNGNLATYFLTEEEKAAQCCPFPKLPEDAYIASLQVKNRFGIYTTTAVPIDTRK